jgi:hypothetical protein
MAEKDKQAAAAPVVADKRVRAAPEEVIEYVALTGITYPDGPENFKLAIAGKMDKVKWLRLEKGDRASDLPAIDVPWLLREKFIKAVKP